MSHLLRRVLLCTLVAVFVSAPAFARSVSIGWDANTEPDLAGYIVRYGTASRNYTVEIDVGNRTDFTLTLEQFTTYYVAVEAYNVDGLHSPVSAEVVVNADYSTCNFTLNRTSAAVGSAASSLTVALTAQDECPWTAASFSSWITVSGRTATRGSGSVLLSIAANPGSMARVGTVAIGGRSLLVTQASASCTVRAAAPTFASFPRQGGSGTITVTASGPQCTWAAVSDSPWLTFAGPVPRIGSTTVSFAVLANTGPIRQGHLTVAGTTFAVVQRPRIRAEKLDFDGRGADALLYDKASGAWKRLTWIGTFAAAQAGLTKAGFIILPADFNGDGRSDLFAYNLRTGAWARSISGVDGTVRFSEFVFQTGWEQPIIADFNGDGRSDVLFYSPRTGNWIQWITQPTTLAFAQYTGRFGPGWTVFRASFDGNLRDDLLLYNANPKSSDPNAGKWARVSTQANLTFVIQPGATAWPERATILPVDFNGDGTSEVFSLTPAGRWTVTTFTGPGSSMATGGNWSLGWQVSPGEFNGDGVPDLLLYNPTTGAYGVALRSGDVFYTLKGVWSKNLSLTLTDLNGDGLSDVVAYAPTLGTWGAAISTGRPPTFIQTGGLFSKSLTVLAEHRRQP